MRIISFSLKWKKLDQPIFTTFRFPRKDRDWEVGEIVQVYYKNRSPEREKLGEAKIVSKRLRYGASSDEEAIADGFKDCQDMQRWMRKTHGKAKTGEPMNKLTLVWMEVK